MRWSTRSERQDKYTCLCCHVRTATLCLGLLHLMGVSFLLFGAMTVQTKGKDAQLSFGDVVFDVEEVAVPENVSYTVCRAWNRESWTTDDNFSGCILFVGLIIIGVMLIYGVHKGDSRYVLPYLCAQMFDFCVTCFTVVGFILFALSHDIRLWLASQPCLAHRERFLRMDSDSVLLTLSSFMLIALLVKYYMMRVVWLCYEYLREIATAASPGGNLMTVSGGGGGGDDLYDIRVMTAPSGERYIFGPKLDEAGNLVMLPPKYEEVMRQSAVQPTTPPPTTPPPKYEELVAAVAETTDKADPPKPSL